MQTTKQELRLQTVCLLLLSAIALGGALHWLQNVVVPFVLALFLSIALAPLVELQMRWLRLPRYAAIAGTLVAAFVLLLLLGAIVLASIGQFAEQSGDYQQRIVEIVRYVEDHLPEGWRRGDAESFDLAALFPADKVQALVVSLTGSVAGILSQGMLVLLIVVFLLLGWSASSAKARGLWPEIERQVTRYVVVKVVVSLATGTLVFLILRTLGINFAVAFGALAFFLNFIPNVGSLVATVLPLPVVILAPDIGPVRAILAIALPGAVQTILGNIVEPRSMGKSLDLHPVSVLLSLMLWGALWGVPGMFLAVPITSVMKIVFERIEPMVPVAELLAGRVSER